MTTCPRCGQPLRAPVAACPRCGQRFAPPAPPQQANGFDGSAPAWVRQAQQPPQPPQQAPARQPQPPYQPPYQPPSPGMYSQQAAPQHQPPSYGQPPVRPGFSAGDLVNEEALPEWLRQASAESAQPTQRQPVPGTAPYGGAPANQPAYQQPYPPANAPASPPYGSPYGSAYNGYGAPPAEEPSLARPDANAFPSIESAGSYQSPLVGGGGMSASSLLDPNALPSWLTGQQGQAPADNRRGGEGMSAQSLVDESALPGWMRNEPSSAQAPAAAPPPEPPGWGGYPAISPPAQVPPMASVGPMGPANPPAPALPPAGYRGVAPSGAAPAPDSMYGQQGFSANQLIDPNAMPGWMQAQGGGTPQQPAPAGGKPWSASDLIDPSMLPGWVRGNEPSAPQANGGNGIHPANSPMSSMSGMPPNPPMDIPRERTNKVPAPRDAGAPMRPGAPGYDPPDRDFGASRAGTAQRGAVSRKHQAARPLGETEKPEWLRNDPADEYGQGGVPPARPSGRQSRNGRSWNGYDDNEAYGQPNPQQNGQRGSRGQMPPAQAGQAWDAPDDYPPSHWSGPRPTRHDARPPAKKRKGGFFGFLRRG